MSHELTQDIVLKMADPSVGNNDPIWKSQPILQVVMLKQITSNKTSQVQERKRGAVSDGKHYVQVMFTTQLNDLIEEDQLQRLSIIKIKHMTCNIMQDKRWVVFLSPATTLPRSTFTHGICPMQTHCCARTRCSGPDH